MSWIAHAIVTDGDFEFTQEPTLESSEHKAQFEAAQESAEALIESGALGNPAGKYNVSLSGHGNPSHAPVTGWANDYVSVSVSQIVEPETEDEE